MSEIKNVDVLIVGAGPAGMVAACLLSRAGLKTLIIERNADFDREFRGEILQPRFHKIMKDIDLYDHIKSAPHEVVRGAHIYFEGVKTVELKISEVDPPDGVIWWMTQPHLLTSLQEYANQFPNFEICFDSTIKSLQNNKAIVSNNNQQIEIKAKVVLGTDGRFSSVRQLGGFELKYDSHDVDVIWFAVPRPDGYKDFFSFFLTNVHNYLILPKYPDLLQCGLILKPGEYGKIRKRGIDSLKEVLRKAHPVFVEFAKQIQDFSQFHPLKGNRAYVKDWAKDGILLIGDAAHTCSPAGGIGVSIAVETTAVAVEVIKEAFEKNDFSHAQLSQLQRHRKKDVKLVHFLQSRARFILNSPRIFRKAAPLAVRILQFLGFLPVFARRILVQPSNFRVSHKRPRYPADLKLGKALELYFKRSGFCRETYTEKWIKLPAGPIFFYLPNITPRKDVVPLHDIDHVLTEYETDWPGEMQITGYELATGLGRYWFGWVINFQGLWLGLTLFPKKFIEGFLRGRRSGCVYRLYEYNDALLEKTVGEIRDQVKVAPRTGHKMEFSDVLALGGVCIASILIHIPFIVGAAAAVYGLIWN